MFWKEYEKEFVRQHASELTDAAVAAKLSEEGGRKVTLQAVRKQRQKMKLKKCQGRGVCKLIQDRVPRGMAFAIRGADV